MTRGCTKEMRTYQLGIEQFTNSAAKVYGISTDNTPSQKVFAEKLGLGFPLLSDFVDRSTAKAYGVFLPEHGIAQRVTFVIDTNGKIVYMEQGQDAVKILGAGNACSRLAHKAAK